MERKLFIPILLGTVREARESEKVARLMLARVSRHPEIETRLFDPVRAETRPMRNKEEAHDYRYFPDPDLLPLEFTPALVAELGAHLPELPDCQSTIR